MISLFYFIILVLSIVFLSNFLKKIKLLLSHSGEKHQEYVEKSSIPMIGGIFLISTFCILFYEIKIYPILLAMLSMFFLGIFSDLKIFNSPKSRFFLQSVIIIFFVHFANLEILETRNYHLDKLMQYKLINFIFVNFCILILVNGNNFIDGLNGLLLGYFIIVSYFLLNIGFFEFYNISGYNLNIYFILFLVMIFFNVSNKLYLGDNGGYVISIFFGFMLINYHQNFSDISPYFVILLLWYPCFENLFSIIRKFKFNKSPIYPDSNHLHQLLFYFLNKKNKLKNIHNNNLSTTIILMVNFLVFSIGTLDIYSTQLQIFSIILAVIIYISSYIVLFKFKFKKFNLM